MENLILIDIWLNYLKNLNYKMDVNEIRDLASEYYIKAGYLELRGDKNVAIKYHSKARALFELIEYPEDVADCDEELSRLINDEEICESWKRIGRYLIEDELNSSDGRFPLEVRIRTDYLFGREKSN